jgi:hypothetical protein
VSSVGWDISLSATGRGRGIDTETWGGACHWGSAGAVDLIECYYHGCGGECLGVLRLQMSSLEKVGLSWPWLSGGVGVDGATQLSRKFSSAIKSFRPGGP